MITKQNLEELGWKLFGASSDGGTLHFGKIINSNHFTISYKGENFLIKKYTPERLTEFELKVINKINLKFDLIITFNTDNLEEFQKIINENT